MKAECVNQQSESIDIKNYTSLSNDEKKTLRNEILSNWQEELDYDFLNSLKRQKLTCLKTDGISKKAYYRGAIQWDHEALNEMSEEKTDIDLMVLKEFMDPPEEISHDDAVQLVIDKPKTLVAAMTLLAHNYNLEMEEKEGLNPGPRNAQFVNTDEESVVFLTGRDLLMRLNEKRQDPYLTELINANDNVIYRMNKRLIWSVVRKYKRLLDSNESFQNGSWGLTIALKRFDIDIGVKFSTYATWWIRQKITREEMNTSTIIRIPVHVRRRVQHFLKNKEKLMKLTGIEPTVDEVVEKYYSDVSELKIRTLKMGLATLSTLSLDRPIDSDEDSSIKMFIENSKSKIKDDIRKIENTELKRTLFELAELTPREQKVIGLRYGLKTKFGYPKRRSHTLDEVAEMYGLTRERIRQIQVLAERKLRRAAGIMKTTGEY